MGWNPLFHDEYNLSINSKKLRYLWIYSAESPSVIAWHRKLLFLRQKAGYHITGICNTFAIDNYRWYSFPELHKKWKKKDPLLMNLYTSIRNEMENHDVLILYNGANLHPDFVNTLPGFKVYTFGDPESWDNLAGPIGPAFDMFFANQPDQIKKFKHYGMKDTFFCPLGSQYFPEDFPNVNETTITDIQERNNSLVLFCGYNKWRKERLDKLVAAFPSGIFRGVGWPQGYCSTDEIKYFYSHAQLGLNLHNTSGFNFRTYDLAACGAMQLCDCQKDIHHVFDDGENIISYDGIDDCIEKARYYLNNPELQRKIALNAYKYYKEKYTQDKIWEFMAKQITAMKSTPQDSHDLASSQYWDERYTQSDIKTWKPQRYLDVCLEKIISEQMNKLPEGSKILEVGCGDSTWIPYFSNKYKFEIDGIDYSEVGCQLARERAKHANIASNIYCQNIFSPCENLYQKYDFVYSLGLVEHFTDTEAVISQLTKFVKKGGILLTEIPNAYAFPYRIISSIYNKSVLDKHFPIELTSLLRSYQNNNLQISHYGYIGHFSLSLIAWGVLPNFPVVDKYIIKIAHYLARKIDNMHLKRKNKKEKYNHMTAPFLYIAGRKI